MLSLAISYIVFPTVESENEENSTQNFDVYAFKVKLVFHLNSSWLHFFYDQF